MSAILGQVGEAIVSAGITSGLAWGMSRVVSDSSYSKHPKEVAVAAGVGDLVGSVVMGTVCPQTQYGMVGKAAITGAVTVAYPSIMGSYRGGEYYAERGSDSGNMRYVQDFLVGGVASAGSGYLTPIVNNIVGLPSPTCWTSKSSSVAQASYGGSSSGQCPF